MVRVAIAGGAGHLGRTLVEGLVESRNHDVFVLSRKVFIHQPLYMTSSLVSNNDLIGRDYL